MALIIHFIRVPRYQNIITNEYETLPVKDLQIINDYFNWKKYKALGTTDCTSLKDWCGVLEADMPHKYIVNYYRDFFNKKEVYNDYDGELVETESIFEDLCRFVKTNQIFNWLINNITNGIADQELHEVSKEQILKLCGALKKVRKYITYDDSRFDINNEDVAKECVPIMENAPVFWGPDEYNELYAEQVVKIYDVVHKILNTTDFEKESVYFVASW